MQNRLPGRCHYRPSNSSVPGWWILSSQVEKQLFIRTFLTRELKVLSALSVVAQEMLKIMDDASRHSFFFLPECNYGPGDALTRRPLPQPPSLILCSSSPNACSNLNANAARRMAKNKSCYLRCRKGRGGGWPSCVICSGEEKTLSRPDLLKALQTFRGKIGNLC